MKETKKTTTRQIENIYKTREEHYLEAIKKWEGKEYKLYICFLTR
jgi:hypothetical protein